MHSQTKNGALVQLVRIRACHARGQGFESPTHRQESRFLKESRFKTKANRCKLLIYSGFFVYVSHIDKGSNGAHKQNLYYFEITHKFHIREKGEI